MVDLHQDHLVTLLVCFVGGSYEGTGDIVFTNSWSALVHEVALWLEMYSYVIRTAGIDSVEIRITSLCVFECKQLLFGPFFRTVLFWWLLDSAGGVLDGQAFLIVPLHAFTIIISFIVPIIRRDSNLA